jgi:hypothetical protein
VFGVSMSFEICSSEGIAIVVAATIRRQVLMTRKDIGFVPIEGRYELEQTLAATGEHVSLALGESNQTDVLLPTRLKPHSIEPSTAFLRSAHVVEHSKKKI